MSDRAPLTSPGASRQRGVISDTEFQAKKADLLNRM